MKKFTTIIAITLLAALLFTGCDFIPMKHDFSHYGFTFTIAGEVTEKEGNKAENATLYTKYGTLTFSVAAILDLGILGQISEENSVADSCPNKETLENGARLYISEAKDNGNGILVIEAYYFIESGEDTWKIKSVTPKDDFNKDALIKVFTSTEFVAIAE